VDAKSTMGCRVTDSWEESPQADGNSPTHRNRGHNQQDQNTACRCPRRRGPQAGEWHRAWAARARSASQHSGGAVRPNICPQAMSGKPANQRCSAWFTRRERLNTPLAVEEVCGIVWPLICRRGAPLERNDPDLWGDRLHRETHRKGGDRRGARPILAGRNLDKVKRAAWGGARYALQTLALLIGTSG
jgi:hypothetical protein